MVSLFPPFVSFGPLWSRCRLLPAPAPPPTTPVAASVPESEYLGGGVDAAGVNYGYMATLAVGMSARCGPKNTHQSRTGPQKLRRRVQQYPIPRQHVAPLDDAADIAPWSKGTGPHFLDTLKLRSPGVLGHFAAAIAF